MVLDAGADPSDDFAIWGLPIAAAAFAFLSPLALVKWLLPGRPVIKSFRQGGAQRILPALMIWLSCPLLLSRWDMYPVYLYGAYTIVVMLISMMLGMDATAPARPSLAIGQPAPESNDDSFGDFAPHSADWERPPSPVPSVIVNVALQTVMLATNFGISQIVFPLASSNGGLLLQLSQMRSAPAWRAGFPTKETPWSKGGWIDAMQLAAVLLLLLQAAALLHNLVALSGCASRAEDRREGSASQADAAGQQLLNIEPSRSGPQRSSPSSGGLQDWTLA